MCAHTIAPHGRPSSVAQLGVADLDRVAALIYLGEELRRPLRRPESLDRVLSGDQDHAPLRAVARVEVLLLPPSACVARGRCCHYRLSSAVSHRLPIQIRVRAGVLMSTAPPSSIDHRAAERHAERLWPGRPTERLGHERGLLASVHRGGVQHFRVRTRDARRGVIAVLADLDGCDGAHTGRDEVDGDAAAPALGKIQLGAVHGERRVRGHLPRPQRQQLVAAHLAALASGAARASRNICAMYVP